MGALTVNPAEAQGLRRRRRRRRKSVPVLGGVAFRAAVTHRCSLVGSGVWHLEIIDGRSMETGSCGIVNT